VPRAIEKPSMLGCLVRHASLTNVVHTTKVDAEAARVGQRAATKGNELEDADLLQLI
jgi:hypothetical protein